MSDHLPECLVPDFENERWICICNQLRACEQRVRAACIAAAKLSITTNPQSDYDEGWNSGIENAIDFMREIQP